MKKIKLLIASLAAISFCSCSDFLDSTPKGTMTEDKFFLSPDAGYGRFSNARPRTGLTPFSVSGSPLILSVHPTAIHFLMATPTKCDSLAFPCNHVFFPILFSLQIFEFSNMVHVQLDIFLAT